MKYLTLESSDPAVQVFHGPYVSERWVAVAGRVRALVRHHYGPGAGWLVEPITGGRIKWEDQRTVYAGNLKVLPGVVLKAVSEGLLPISCSREELETALAERAETHGREFSDITARVLRLGGKSDAT